MAVVFLSVLFAHWLAFLSAMQRFFWTHTPRPLLSTVFPHRIEGSSAFSQLTHVPRIRDHSDFNGSTDLTTICRVPTIFQAPLPTNFSCSIDCANYDLYDPFQVESSDHTAFLNWPSWRPVGLGEEAPRTPPSAQEGDPIQTTMAPYGERGLSFCPVLIGIMYIQSLFYLYMLLMIPSLFYHWFEDVLIYESLNPVAILECGSFLHTSLWMVPWHLLRCGVCKFVSCLYHVQPVTRELTSPPIPRIVLTRADGEVLPVDLVDDGRPNVDTGVLPSFKVVAHEDSDMTFEGGEPEDSVQSLILCSVTSFAASPLDTEALELGSFAIDFVEDDQFLENQIPDGTPQASPTLVEVKDEPLEFDETDTLVLPISRPDLLVESPSDSDTDELTVEAEKKAFLESDDAVQSDTGSLPGWPFLENRVSYVTPQGSPVEAAIELFDNVLTLPTPGLETMTTRPSDVDERTGNLEKPASLRSDDVHQDDADSAGPPLAEESDLDPITFSPWSLIDDPGPDEIETLPEMISATDTFVELQVSPGLAPTNVGFAGGDAAMEVIQQETFNSSQTDELPTPINHLCPDETWTLSGSMAPTNSLEGPQVSPTSVRLAIGEAPETKVTQRIAVSSLRKDEHTCELNLGNQLGDDDVAPVEISVTPCNMQMDKQDASSPVQLIKPVFPVVLDDDEVEENDAVRVEPFSSCSTGELIVNLPLLVTTREDMRLVEMDPISPTAMTEDVVTCSPLQMFSPIGPVVAINTSHSAMVEEQGLTPVETEEPDLGLPCVEDALETSDDTGPTKATFVVTLHPEGGSRPLSPSVEYSSLVHPPVSDCETSFGDIQTLENTSASGVASGRGMLEIDASVVEVLGTTAPKVEASYESIQQYADGDLTQKLPKKHEMMVNFRDAATYTSMVVAIFDQPADLPGALPTDLPTTKQSEDISTSPDTCNEAGPLSMISTEKIDCGLEDGRSRETDTIPVDLASFPLSNIPPERTLRGSMHAPSDLLSNDSQTFVLYEEPSHLGRNVSWTRSEEAKGATSTITDSETAPRRKQDLYASIYAPQCTLESELQSSVSQSGAESDCDHCRSVANSVVSGRMPVTNPCPPNWSAMPEVVDAFRMFKAAPSGNAMRRRSTVVEHTNRGRMLGVSRKGIATSSLNDISAIANIQNRWMQGNGLLLVRDLVPSDPADFNLRNCTNLRIPKMHGQNAMSVQQIVYTGMFDVPPDTLQNDTALEVDTGSSVMEGGSTGIQRQPRFYAGAAQSRRRERDDAWLSPLDGLQGLKETEIM